MLLEAFCYEIGEVASGAAIVVPVGFLTDFASIPRPFWWLIKPDDPGIAKAAVLHDFLYQQAVGKMLSDAIFWEAMGILGCPNWKRNLCWIGLFFGGWPTWLRYRREKTKQEVDFAETAIETMVEDPE